MKIKILFTLIITLALAYSCEDVLDRPPLDKISDSDVWLKESLLEGYIIDLYNQYPFFDHGTNSYNFYLYGDEGTRSGGNSNAITNGTMSKNDIVSSIEYWDYEFIRDCNIFLEKIGDTPIADDTKNKFEGEVRAIRAAAYFEMAMRYGGVPLVTEVIDPFQPVDEELQTRNLEVDIYDFIDSELTIAVQLLEEQTSKSPTARFNKWSALALQSRSNLWAASIAKYGKVDLGGIVGVPENRANEFYQKALDAASEVINSGVYSLYNGYADKAVNYQYIFLDEGNSEVIFSKEYNGVEIRSNWDYWNAPIRFSGGQGGRCNPTLELILQYENIDGSVEDYTQYFDENHLFTDGREIFERKDPRLFATVLFQGTPYVDDYIKTYEGIDTAVVPDPAKIVNNPNLTYEGFAQVGIDSRLVIGDDKTTNSGFLVRKWNDEPNLPVPISSSTIDWIEIRLAELYLNKAEADFQLGNTAEAVTALNAVRSRAGISLVDESTISMEKIQNEWLVEFAFENRRYWDLRRWRIAESVLNHQFHGLRIIWHFYSDKYYFLPFYCEPFNRVFREEHYYNPIVSSRIDNNPLLVQNPLY